MIQKKPTSIDRPLREQYACERIKEKKEKNRKVTVFGFLTQKKGGLNKIQFFLFTFASGQTCLIEKTACAAATEKTSPFLLRPVGACP